MTQIEAAFRDWRSGEAYWSPRRNKANDHSKGSYRLKATGRVAPWSQEVRRQFGNTWDFHSAAVAK